MCDLPIDQRGYPDPAVLLLCCINDEACGIFLIQFGKNGIYGVNTRSDMVRVEAILKYMNLKRCGMKLLISFEKRCQYLPFLFAVVTNRYMYQKIYSLSWLNKYMISRSLIVICTGVLIDLGSL